MYEYATGLLRVLEKRILSQNDFERMSGAKTAAEAFKVLNDTDYADNLLNLKPEKYEKALKLDEKDLKKLFKKIVENQKLLQFLFLKDDFLNLKLYFKKKFGKIDANLRMNANDANKTDANPRMNANIANKVVEKLKKLKKITPRKIDEICDLELYKERKNIAKKLRDKFLQKINKKDLDLNYDLEFIKTEARNYAYGSPIILEYYYKKLDAERKIRMIMNQKLNRCE